MESEFHDVIMPHGPHRGFAIGSIPSDYLVQFLDREGVASDQSLRDAVRAELAYRFPDGHAKAATTPQPTSSTVSRAAADLDAIIRKWFRELCLTYHPDRRPGDGGEAMKAIIVAHQLLRKLLELPR